MSKKSTKSSGVPLLLVQEFLLNHSFADLHKEHGVKFRPSACGRKVSLNYDMIEAHDSNKIAQQCRGLILAKADNCVFSGDQEVVGETYIVARPFDRFFNLGQAEAANIDWDSAKFLNKEDGTLIICYFDAFQRRWHVATRAVPEANLPIDGYDNMTFRKLFDKALSDCTGYLSLDKFAERNLDTSVTYMFELCTPQNQIVVKYDKYEIILLGARGTMTGQEIALDDPFFNPVFAAGIKVVPEYSLSSTSDMIDFVTQRNPTEFEGIVACDSRFRRVKVKNAGYMALSRVKDSATKSPRGLMQMILIEKLDDFIPLLPEYLVERANLLQDGYRNLVHGYNHMYAKCMAEADKESPIFNPESKSLQKQHQKSFAIAVQRNGGWLAPMMNQYNGQADGLHDYIIKRRAPGGDWTNAFLDTVIEMIDKTLKESN